jgi:hypothetical protein
MRIVITSASIKMRLGPDDRVRNLNNNMAYVLLQTGMGLVEISRAIARFLQKSVHQGKCGICTASVRKKEQVLAPNLRL